MYSTPLGVTTITPEIFYQKIWDEVKPDIDLFIELFIYIDNHEVLHKTIIEALEDEQERMIDALLGGFYDGCFRR